MLLKIYPPKCPGKAQWILDFLQDSYVNTDSNKPTGVVSAIAFNMATNSSGERVHSATHEQETGEDLNGITVDLGN